MRIVHIITTMNTGGAERMLSNLLNYDTEHTQILIILTKGDIKYFLPSNIEVITLNFDKKINVPIETIKLFRILKELKPDIIQTWLNHPNFLGLLYKKYINKNVILLWNIRYGYKKHKSYSIKRILLDTLKRNSEKVNGIVFVSKDSLREHKKNNFNNNNSIVLPNGFLRDRATSIVLKENLNIPESSFVVGHVGRYSPIKNQKIILEAYNKLCDKGYEVALLMIGREITTENKDLIEYVNIKNRKYLYMMGEQFDLDQYYRLMDIFVLSSFSEGFPNVIGESMINKTPVITTNSGDSFDIVENCGFKMKTYGSEELASLLENIIKEPSEVQDLGIKSRERIINEYEIGKIASKYFLFYKNTSSKFE